MTDSLARALLLAHRAQYADGGDIFAGIDPANRGAAYLDETQLYNQPSAPPLTVTPSTHQGIGWWPAIKQVAANTAQGLYDTVMAPADVMEGRASMRDPATQDKIIGLGSMLAAPGLGADDAALLSTGATKFEGKPITAYHGSPHSFDQFDISKIGTGEGAQAYGHGLYFAGNEKVAQSYRDALSASQNIPKVTLDGTPLPDIQGLDVRADPRGWAQELLTQTEGDAAKAARKIANSKHENAAETRNLLQSGRLGYEPGNKGAMYEIAIHADPDHFLDWNKPLGEQHPIVQQAFYGGRGIPDSAKNMLGYEALVKLGKALGENRSGSPAAARHLKERGVPGIKYLDAGSRYLPADELSKATHNYVAFDHNIVDLIRKYGVAGIPIAGGAYGAFDRNAFSPQQDVPHMARGGGLGALSFGHGVPGSAPMSVPAEQAVLPANLVHGYMRHALRMRPHFESGGWGGGSDSDSGNDGAGSSVGYGGFGAGIGAGNTGSGYGTTGVGGYGIGGFGGAVGSVSGGSGSGGYGTGNSGYGHTSVGATSNNANSYGGGSSSNSYGGSSDTAGYGGGLGSYGTGTTMGNAMASLGGLGAGNTGYGFSSSGNGGGNIGPSGVATGAGIANNNVSQAGFGGLAGFGNFGSASLGEGTGGKAGNYSGGLNDGTNYGFGLGNGYSAFGADVDTSLGKAQLGNAYTGTISQAIGNIAQSLGLGGLSSSDNYGSLGGFDGSTLSQPGWGSFAANPSTASVGSGFSNYGNLTGADVSTMSQPASDPVSLAIAAQAVNQASDPTVPSVLGAGSLAAPAQGIDAVNGGAFTGIGETSGDDAHALTVHGDAFNSAGNFAGADPAFGMSGYTNADDIGAIGRSPMTGQISTPNRVGFDNFGLSDNALTASLFGGQTNGYTPAGWSQVGEAADMVTSPGDYFGADHPALAQYSGFNTLSPGFAAGLLGNANVESGANQVSPTAIRTNAVNEIGAIGMFQHLGDRKVGMMNQLGVNSDDQVRGLGPDAFSTQLGYGLNEVASNPAYAKTLAAALDQGISPEEATRVVMTNFLRPSAAEQQQSIAARLASADAFSKAIGQAKAYSAANLGLGSLGGDAIGGSSDAAPMSAPDAPRQNVSDDVRAALAMSDLAATGQSGDYFSSGAASGEDGMSPAERAAEQARWNAAQDETRGILAGNVTLPGGPAPTSDDSYINSFIERSLPEAMATPTAVSSSLPAIEAMRDTINAARDRGLPSFMASPGFMSSETASDGGWSTPLGTSEAAPSDVAIAPTGLTINGTPTNDGVTPSYAPGEKTALKTGLNMAAGMVPGLGLANLVSGLFGGPTVGGWVADHSRPGEPANASGNANSHNSVMSNGTQFRTGYDGNRVPVSTASAAVSNPSVAQAAYLTAIKNLPGPGPAAKKSNAVPLRAPGSSTVKYYNPLEDPRVLEALAAAHA